MRPIWSFKIQIFVRPCLALKNTFLGSYHNCIFVPQLLAICISSSFYCILASHLLGIISQFLLFLLWPHFGQIIKLSLSFITFRVSHFPVSHLTYETVKLGLQNTPNMSKTTRVYFGVLQFFPPYKNFVLKIHTLACACSVSDHFFSCLLMRLERDSHLSHQSSIRTKSPVLIFQSWIDTYSF